MKKEVTYYLEDTSRLSEISKSELDAWIAEMPFHQPLQILASIKSEMESHSMESDNKVYAAYFAEDFEAIKKSRSKSNKNTKQLATTIDIQPEINSDDKKKPVKAKAKKKLPEIVHSLADDTLEDQVKKEVTEDFTKIETISEVSSELATDLLEDEVISEVLEENITIVTPLVAKEEQNEVQSDTEAKDVEDLLSLDADKGQKVDYSEFTNFVYDTKDGAKDVTEEVVKDIAEEISNDLDDIPNEVKSTDSELDENNSEIEAVKETKSLNPKSQKAKDKSKKKKKKKGKKKDTEKEDVKKKKKKKAPKKKKEEKEEEKKSRKDKTIKPKKDKSKKNKKKVKGASIKVKKGKTKKRDKEVKYIIVDSAKNKNFKLKDYDGVSSYTSWLLEQESINGNALNKTAQGEMKKSKKKKKKKKSKSLKIAADSIKKQDSIISEPLANILALQGHKKKARKMYAKLAFVFPEKKEYFEEKIESLKK